MFCFRKAKHIFLYNFFIKKEIRFPESPDVFSTQENIAKECNRTYVVPATYILLHPTIDGSI